MEQMCTAKSYLLIANVRVVVMHSSSVFPQKKKQMCLLGRVSSLERDELTWFLFSEWMMTLSWHLHPVHRLIISKLTLISYQLIQLILLYVSPSNMYSVQWFRKWKLIRFVAHDCMSIYCYFVRQYYYHLARCKWEEISIDPTELSLIFDSISNQN